MLVPFFILDLTIFGTLLTYLFGFKWFLEERLAAGVLIGFVVLGYLMFGLSQIFKISPTALFIFLVLINAVLLTSSLNLRNVKEDIGDFTTRLKQKPWILFLGFNLVFISVFCYLASQLLTFKDGGLYVQPVHAYGDISLHLLIISSFAYGQNFPPQNPILVGEKISYPFMADFISAVFVGLGLRLDQAVAIGGILLTAAFIIMLSFFSLHLTKSKLAAGIITALFLFNGGLGFVYFFEDFNNANFSLEFLRNIPKDYTALKDLGFWWINVGISMMLPQRSFLFGFPLSLMILRIFWDLTKQFDNKKFIFGMVLVSLLPLVHTHSLIALSPFLAWFFLDILKNHGKFPLLFVTGVLSLAVAMILARLYFNQVDTPIEHLRIQIGWMSQDENPAIFFLKNFGPIILLTPLVLFNFRKERLFTFGIVGLIWFILPSLFLFQPWEYDNTKLYIYWYFTACVLVGLFISKFIRLKFLFLPIVALFIIMVLSGFLDILRLLQSSGTRYQVYSPQAVKLGEFFRQNTEQDSLILSVDKFDNPALALGGRKVVVGYHGWLWTYGLDFEEKDKDVRQMLAGNGEELLGKYGIDYVVLFNEPTEFIIDKDYFEKFKPVYNRDGYLVYELP